MRDSGSEKVAEKENVLRGPPGLLFGLTLLVFLAAGLYFSWPSEAISAPDTPPSNADAILVQQALDREDARVLEPGWPEP